MRQQAIRSCRKLGVEQIGLWQLHRIHRKVPREAQFAAVKALLDHGIIKHAGLSEVSVADIKAASQVFQVATVQNRYNLVDRGSEDLLVMLPIPGTSKVSTSRRTSRSRHSTERRGICCSDREGRAEYAAT